MNDKVEKLIKRRLREYSTRKYVPEDAISGAFQLWDTACLISGGCLTVPYSVYYDEDNRQHEFSFSDGHTSLFIESCHMERDKIKVVRINSNEEITVKLLKGEPGSKSRQIADIIFDGFIEGQDGR